MRCKVLSFFEPNVDILDLHAFSSISNAFLPRFMYFKKDAKNVKRRQPYVTFTLNALDV
eukprot:SAG11_NODE_3023_length_2755_cov_48.730422_2_plen_59_part_00